MNHWFRDVGAWRHGHERLADIKKSIFDAKKRSMGKEWEGSVGKEGTFTRAGTAKCIDHHPPLSNMTTSNKCQSTSKLENHLASHSHVKCEHDPTPFAWVEGRVEGVESICVIENPKLRKLA